MTALVRLERWVATAMVGLSVAVTAFGLAWLAQRSHDVGRTAALLDRRPEPVLVSRVAHLFRESGWYAQNGHRWLTAVTDEQVADAARVVSQAGFDRFGLVTLDDGSAAPAVPGYTTGRQDRFEWISGVPMLVTTYGRAP